MDPSIIKIPAPDFSTLWENEEYGIRADAEFQRYDHRSFNARVVNLANTNFNGLLYSKDAGCKRLISSIVPTHAAQFGERTPIGKTDSLGLVIFFHGLHGQPSLWDSHVEQLKHLPLDIYVPQIPEAGVCDLRDPLFDYLLERIVDWTKRNPLQPIALFGQSNGSRVATHFEFMLREKAPATAVHVSLTAGVLFGSKVVEAVGLDAIHASLKPSSYNIYADLTYASPSSKTLLTNARTALANNVAPRFYTMYAAFHDHHVYSLGSALPVINPNQQLGKKESHYIIFNHGHNSAPLGVTDKQIAKCVKWLSAHANHGIHRL